MKYILNLNLASDISTHPAFVNKVLNDFSATLDRILQGRTIQNWTTSSLVVSAQMDLGTRIIKAMPTTPVSLIRDLMESIRPEGCIDTKGNGINCELFASTTKGMSLGQSQSFFDALLDGKQAIEDGEDFENILMNIKERFNRILMKNIGALIASIG